MSNNLLALCLIDIKCYVLQDFRQNGDDAIVDIEVRLKQEKLSMVMEEGLMKKFKLTSSISTSNMHLFDSEGKIKKYDNPEQSINLLNMKFDELFPLYFL